MTTINLKDFYYWYTQDQFIEVSDEVAEVFLADARYEMAYQRRLSRHKAQYSLDCEDGIEYSACLHEPTPQELLERMELFIRLWNALNSLPEVQGRRVDACVILGKTYSEVAEAEGVDESAVRRAVERGLENMKKYLKLEQMKSVDIGAVSPESLPDVSGMTFDNALSRKERVTRFLQVAKNLYCFNIGGVGVKIEFAEGGPSLQDTLTDYLIRQKSGL